MVTIYGYLLVVPVNNHRVHDPLNRRMGYYGEHLMVCIHVAECL